jgi:hypothetical protein
MVAAVVLIVLNMLFLKPQKHDVCPVCFNIKMHCIFPVGCIYGLCIIPRITSDSIPIQH